MLLSIRRAALSDASDITQCVISAYSTYIERMGQKPGPMLDDYSEVISQHRVFVAEGKAAVSDTNTVILGILVLQQSDQGWLLDNVAVDPKFHGRGVGKHLINYAETLVANNGEKHLDLYTHERMTENIAMYMAMGYDELERKRVGSFDRVYMRKLL